MSMALGLFLDTSSKYPIMALIIDANLVDFCSVSSEKSSSVFIIEVNEFLEKNKVTFKQLSYLCVGTGPGSFIGTRVAVILAKTFSYALKIPLLHFSSLKCYQVDSSGPFALLSDAKSKGFYALFGSKNGSYIDFESEPKLLSDAELASFTDSTTLLSADADFISKKNLKCFNITLTNFAPLQIASLAHKSYVDYLKNPKNLTPPEIFYLRLS